MFDARSDEADTKTFAERCEEDRHHLRFVVSPEDASNMADLKTFTRKLMKVIKRANRTYVRAAKHLRYLPGKPPSPSNVM